jgi:hypothetical protein
VNPGTDAQAEAVGKEGLSLVPFRGVTVGAVQAELSSSFDELSFLVNSKDCVFKNETNTS